MIRRILALMILGAFLVSVTGCGRLLVRRETRGGNGFAAPGTPSTEVSDGALTVWMQPSALRYKPGDPVLVRVMVRNDGKEPVSWIGMDGCDSGLFAEVRPVGGQAVGRFEEHRTGEPRACTDAIVVGKLEPGAQIQRDFIWFQRLGDNDAPAPAGQYVLTAGLKRGSHYDQISHFGASIEITLAGGKAASAELTAMLR